MGKPCATMTLRQTTIIIHVNDDSLRKYFLVAFWAYRLSIDIGTVDAALLFNTILALQVLCPCILDAKYTCLPSYRPLYSDSRPHADRSHEMSLQEVRLPREIPHRFRTQWAESQHLCSNLCYEINKKRSANMYVWWMTFWECGVGSLTTGMTQKFGTNGAWCVVTIL